MEPKKSEKADLSKKSFLFFQLGLVFMLALSLFLIEFKTYDKEKLDTGVVELDMLDDEDVPITEQLKTPPPPPPPPPAPEVIEVVEDEADVEETIIESTETSMDEIVEVEEVADIGEEEEIEDVPFSSIQDVPIFPGCEKEKDNDARRACMSKKIQDFVNKKFDTSLGSELGLSGINRVYVRFKIDKTGKVVDVQARSSHPRLTQEGERVVNKLPDMKPGKQRGRAVGVIYTLPITFQVQN
jgi:protein TonB